MTLLDDLKNKLRITWDDQDGDLLKLIDRSMAYYKNLTNSDTDFTNNDHETELLLERCRYVHNNAANDFEVNYSHELKRVILQVALKKVDDLDE